MHSRLRKNYSSVYVLFSVILVKGTMNLSGQTWWSRRCTVVFRLKPMFKIIRHQTKTSFTMVMMNYSMLGLQMNLLWEPIDLDTVQLQEKFRNYLIDTDFCESLI